MENNVPKASNSAAAENRRDFSSNRARAEASPGASGATAVGQTLDRSLEARRTVAQQEIERLVSAAFRVIRQTGHLEPKVSEILAEAGLSNQAFYRHFRSKHELLVAVLDEGIGGLGRYLSSRMAQAESPVEAVREWIRGMAVQAQDEGGAAATRPFALGRGRLAETFPAEIARSETQVTTPLRAALEAARANGTMPAVAPEQEAEALYHLMMGWVEARLVEARIPGEAEVERLEAFAMAGLQRPEPTRSDSTGEEISR